jgi:hypothetical protein
MPSGILAFPAGGRPALWDQEWEVRLDDGRCRLRHRQEQAFAAGMREAGVDVARWLAARRRHPDRQIRIAGRADLQAQVAER